MPYDEHGRYLYPLPVKKKRPEKSPKPETSPKGKKSRRPELEPEAPEPPGTPLPEPVAISEPPVLDNLDFEERELAELWNAQTWPAGTKLVTAGGQEVKVIYRGRWSYGLGPDFRGAILDFGGEVRRGDVELHLQTQGWREHGHHTNPQYNSVILHIALTGGEVVTAGGEHPATIALLDVFRGNRGTLRQAIASAQRSGTRLGSVSESEGPCCERVAERHPDLEEVLRHIDSLGEKRFLDRAARYEAEFAGEVSPAQALWSGLLEALGYSQNKGPFRQLAQVLPLSLALEVERESRLRGEQPEERATTLEAALLGAAGLLPGQRKPKNHEPLQETLFPEGVEDFFPEEDWAAGRYVEELERRWSWLERYLRAASPFNPMRETDWNFARLRPVNHPARRIAGLTRLLVRHSPVDEQDLLDKIVALTNNDPVVTCKQLATFFVVDTIAENASEGGVFWAQRYDLNLQKLPGNGKDPAPALIGPDRAADIVVNVALPFLEAYGSEQGDRELARKALEAYKAHPRLGNNELVANVARQVFRYWLEGPGELPERYRGKGRVNPLSNLVTGAMRQQGLIQLHHRFCAEQDWGDCPLG